MSRFENTVVTYCLHVNTFLQLEHDAVDAIFQISPSVKALVVMTSIGVSSITYVSCTSSFWSVAILGVGGRYFFKRSDRRRERAGAAKAAVVRPMMLTCAS